MLDIKLRTMKIISATSRVPLYYPRSILRPGTSLSEFSKYQGNPYLIAGLHQAKEIVISLFWRPIGDTLLFLSVVQACYEYICLTGRTDDVTWLVTDAHSSLIKHIPYLNTARTVFEATRYFRKKMNVGYPIALITDDDPEPGLHRAPVFNSEEFMYPEYVEYLPNGEQKKYISRPARYFLTFEREVNMVLKSEPSLALPEFTLPYNQTVNAYIYKKYGFDPDDDILLVALISVSGVVQKRFGTLRYIKLAMKLLEDNPSYHFILIANSREESPDEWLLVKDVLKKRHSNITLISGESQELLAYLFSRCEFVIGNDTGLSHLAAMSKVGESLQPPQVFILYSRHDFGKWSTGKGNVHPISTKLSRYLRNKNMSVRRDNINLSIWKNEAWAYSISENEILTELRSVGVI